MKTARIVAVWLLMLALPLQGLAALAPSADCAESASAQAAQFAHVQHQDHHGAAAQTHEHAAGSQQHDDGQPVDHASTHSCCHQVFTGATATAVPGTPAPPHAVIPRASLLATLHIPELPLRPPQA